MQSAFNVLCAEIYLFIQDVDNEFSRYKLTENNPTGTTKMRKQLNKTYKPQLHFSTAVISLFVRYTVVL